MCNWSLAHCQPPPNPPLATKNICSLATTCPFGGHRTLPLISNFLLLWVRVSYFDRNFVSNTVQEESQDGFSVWQDCAGFIGKVSTSSQKKYVSPTPVSCIVKEEGTWCSRGWWMSLIYVQLAQQLHCTCLRKWSSYNVMEGICRGLVVFVALLLRDVSELGG